MQRRAEARREARLKLAQQQAAREQRDKAARDRWEEERAARRAPFSHSFYPGTNGGRGAGIAGGVAVPPPPPSTVEGCPPSGMPSSSFPSSLDVFPEKKKKGRREVEVEKLAKASGIFSWKRNIWELVIAIQQTKEAELSLSHLAATASSSSNNTPFITTTASSSSLNDASFSDHEERRKEERASFASRGENMSMVEERRMSSSSCSSFLDQFRPGSETTPTTNNRGTILLSHDTALQQVAEDYYTLSLLSSSLRRWRKGMEVEKCHRQQSFPPQERRVCSALLTDASVSCVSPPHPSFHFQEKLRKQQHLSAKRAAEAHASYYEAQKILLNDVLLPVMEAEAAGRLCFSQAEERKRCQIYSVMQLPHGPRSTTTTTTTSTRDDGGGSRLNILMTGGGGGGGWCWQQSQRLRRIYFMKWAELGWERKEKREAQLYRLRLERKAREILRMSSGGGVDDKKR